MNNTPEYLKAYKSSEDFEYIIKSGKSLEHSTEAIGIIKWLL